jgi:hypothetical protein
MKGLLESRRSRDSSGDDKVDSADALFELLESKDAYVPTRGKEQGVTSATPAKRKGVRTA